MLSCYEFKLHHDFAKSLVTRGLSTLPIGILDSEQLISAILKDRIPEQIILFVAEQDDFEWLVSSDILAEYKAVIHLPKFKTIQKREKSQIRLSFL